MYSSLCYQTAGPKNQKYLLVLQMVRTLSANLDSIVPRSGCTVKHDAERKGDRLASRTTRVSDKLDVMLLCDQRHVKADSTSHQIYLRPLKHALSASIIKSDKIMGLTTSRRPTHPKLPSSRFAHPLRLRRLCARKGMFRSRPAP